MKKTLSYIFLIAMGWSCNSHIGEHHSNMQSIKENSIEGKANYEGLSTFNFVNESDLTIVYNDAYDTLFYIPKRTGEMVAYPCSSCHTNNTIDANYDSEFLQKAHWNIELAHATGKVLDCRSCHNADNITTLKTSTGAEIDFDHSYQLCGQCHSTQMNDWVGGAHGKRLGGWTTPRVSNTCVNCHDPHKPAFSSRWPARLNTVKISEIND